MKSSEKATLSVRGRTIDLPLLEGTENRVAIDITKLRSKLDCVTYDSGFANTASCLSNISHVDADKGILLHRGYAIEDLVKHCTFVEVAYLLVHGSLPTASDLKRFSSYLNRHSMIHENMHHFFNGFPSDSHPMLILASMVTSLSGFYPTLTHRDPSFDITAARLISKVRTIAAFSYKKSLGEPVVYPRHDLSYCANFLNMMFSSPVHAYEIDPEFVDVLNKLLILHVDHGQNCSTTAVRLIGSARANLYAAISAGICALWGPLHGGANQAVIEMLNRIKNDSRNVRKYVNKAKNRNDSFRLMGFGHPVYKSYDPRARICREMCEDVFRKREFSDPLLDIARELERIALKDDYFIEKKLYPNVDFYTGILYRAMEIPTDMLTVMFAIGRLPGWIAQWKELAQEDNPRICRPRQVYTGPARRQFVPIKKRKREKSLSE